METDLSPAERERILRSAFESLEPLKLKFIPVKYKKKRIVVETVAGLFEEGRAYTEKEVNEILSSVFPDFVTLRRYLVDFGHLARTRSGSSYTKLPPSRKDA